MGTDWRSRASWFYKYFMGVYALGFFYFLVVGPKLHLISGLHVFFPIFFSHIAGMLLAWPFLAMFRRVRLPYFLAGAVLGYLVMALQFPSLYGIWRMTFLWGKLVLPYLLFFFAIVLPVILYGLKHGWPWYVRGVCGGLLTLAAALIRHRIDPILHIEPFALMLFYAFAPGFLLGAMNGPNPWRLGRWGRMFVYGGLTILFLWALLQAPGQLHIEGVYISTF